MTSTDGKQLEALVSFVEGILLPKGFQVKTNKRVFNEDGVQLAEFDVEIKGKVGSTNISWLIECRDRPSEGPAPGCWIEQLAGRRRRFKFNKVTAVSTTGFASVAIDFARDEGIELREVNAFTPEAFEWLKLREIRMEHRFTMLQHATFFIKEPTSERENAFAEALSSKIKDEAFLKSTTTWERVNPATAFARAVNNAESLWEAVQPNASSKKINLHAKYNEEDCFVVETRLGEILIVAIQFYGELRIEEAAVPIVTTSRYEHADQEGVISQFVAFAPHEMRGHNFLVELHRMGDDGETHLRLRIA